MKAIKINNKEDYKKAEQLLIEKGYEIDTEWNKWIADDMVNDPSQHYILMIEGTACLHNHSGYTEAEIIYENIKDFLASEE